VVTERTDAHHEISLPGLRTLYKLFSHIHGFSELHVSMHDFWKMLSREGLYVHKAVLRDHFLIPYLQVCANSTFDTLTLQTYVQLMF
jgi:hypothetical protein